MEEIETEIEGNKDESETGWVRKIMLVQTFETVAIPWPTNNRIKAIATM